MSYQHVIDTVPALIEKVKPDIVLHIGLAAGRFLLLSPQLFIPSYPPPLTPTGRTFYTLERAARKDIYTTNPDVDSHTFPPTSSPPYYAPLPTTLTTGFSSRDLYRRWRSLLPDHSIDIRPSPDAGNFLCGFTYYSSLALFAREGTEGGIGNGVQGERPVMFLHVPVLNGEAEVRQGREVACALVRAMVESRREIGVGFGNAE